MLLGEGEQEEYAASIGSPCMTEEFQPTSPSRLSVIPCVHTYPHSTAAATDNFHFQANAHICPRG